MQIMAKIINLLFFRDIEQNLNGYNDTKGSPMSP